MKIHIQHPISEPITHYKTGAVYFLKSFDETFPYSEKEIARIVEINNQTHIYNWIWNDRLDGKPYPIEKAEGFRDFAVSGWNKQEWFVFLIVDEERKILGALDIKSNNQEAEIGYWMSAEGSGLMTNAVSALCEIAKLSGFKSLVALVKPGNEASSNILLRNTFGVSDLNFLDKDSNTFIKYVKLL